MAQTAPRAVRSAFMQSRNAHEVVVVDDGSTDSRELCDALCEFVDHRFRYHKLPTNMGPAAARNAGARLASGDLLGFLDGDDELHPDWLESSMHAFTPSADTRIVTSGITRCDQRDGSTEDRLPERLGPAFHGMVARFHGPPTLLVDRRLFNQIGGYDPHLRYGENTDLGLRVAAVLGPNYEHQSAVVPQSLAQWNWAGPTRHSAPNRLASSLEILKKHQIALRRDPILRRRFLAEVEQCQAAMEAAPDPIDQLRLE